jgi:hypothetical protein
MKFLGTYKFNFYKQVHSSMESLDISRGATSVVQTNLVVALEIIGFGWPVSWLVQR